MTRACLTVQEQVRLTPTGATADKWRVFQDLRVARERIGATDRALAILNALLSFHPEQNLSLGANCVVWPSNERLRTRANGMSLPTLRRHLANLVACGLIIRRDSPNGKRYARTGATGTVTTAFGFDLSPLIARAGEIARLAAEAGAERETCQIAREHITLCRRDIVKLLALAGTEAQSGPWQDLHGEYATIIGGLKRTADLQSLEHLGVQLERLRFRISNLLQTYRKIADMSASACQNDTHIQESKTEESTEKESSAPPVTNGSGKALRGSPIASAPLHTVLQTCPDIVWLSRDGRIRDWPGLIDAMTPARAMLGLNQALWLEACNQMGVENAALAIAVIYQAGDRISSPRGYLAQLVQQAGRGTFSAWALLMAHAPKQGQQAAAAGGGRAIRASMALPEPDVRHPGPVSRNLPRDNG